MRGRRPTMLVAQDTWAGVSLNTAGPLSDLACILSLSRRQRAPRRESHSGPVQHRANEPPRRAKSSCNALLKEGFRQEAQERVLGRCHIVVAELGLRHIQIHAPGLVGLGAPRWAAEDGLVSWRRTHWIRDHARSVRLGRCRRCGHRTRGGRYSSRAGRFKISLSGHSGAFQNFRRPTLQQRRRRAAAV